ncbi:MAG: glycosyltransferase family 2 protein [Planctomycetia bacterium]|nr:glycosyltransferase family 2 protein [Planctomycetia bacterium]
MNPTTPEPAQTAEPLNHRRDVTDPLLSFVLPVYNEAQVLATLATLLADAARRCRARYEMIFVDDGSSDGSGQLLDELAERNPEIKVVHLSRNFGHQAAVQAGLCRAQGDAVVLMDSDLQDAPEAVPRLFAQWRAGYDVVYAVRTQRKENVLKRALFAGFHRLLGRISSTPIPADAGIFGLVDARVAREISNLAERDRYLPGLRSWVGFRQIGVEVERRARYDDHARVSLGGLWRLAKTAIFGFSTVPLAAFYLIGISAMAVFLALSGYAVFCKLFTTLAVPGWTTHVLTATFFGALNALGISILGEYVTRIYDQVRQRPLYLVARTVNLTEETTEPHRAAAPAIDEEIAELAASFSAFEAADRLDEEVDYTEVELLALLEEANALLGAAQGRHDRAGSEARQPAWPVREYSRRKATSVRGDSYTRLHQAPAAADAASSTRGVLTDPRD